MKKNPMKSDNNDSKKNRWTSDTTSLSILLPSTIEEPNYEDEEDDKEEKPDADAATS